MMVRIVKEQGSFSSEQPDELVKAQNSEPGDTLIASSERGFGRVMRLRLNLKQHRLVDKLIARYGETPSALPSYEADARMVIGV